MGLGLGLLIGFIIVNASMGRVSDVSREMAQTQSVIYGASTLLFGGMGLIAGFIAEIRLKKK